VAVKDKEDFVYASDFHGLSIHMPKCGSLSYDANILDESIASVFRDLRTIVDG
jgi:hypothetical protein